MTAATTTSSPPPLAEPKVQAHRIFNFFAGPATLPEEVIQRARQDLWSVGDSGVGILEHSHRGKVFERILNEAIADCRILAEISDDYEVLFLQGGATLQFAMVPMNFLPPDGTADYLDTGVWTTKAIEEAQKIGRVHVAFSSANSNYDHTPAAGEINFSRNPAYVHYCSNNTIYGTRYNRAPKTSAPLVSDMSSEMFSRPIEIDRHAIIFAGAQKNLGPAGVVLVIIRKDFMKKAQAGLPALLDYNAMAEKNSCLNTPPTFGIYFMGQVFKWILKNGGLRGIEERNNRKAKLIYDAIDECSDFYQPVARPDCRSVMNITFRCPSEELDQRFIEEAKKNEMEGLKGHRSVKGLRASVYNAFPEKGCEVLAELMKDFARRNG